MKPLLPPIEIHPSYPLRTDTEQLIGRVILGQVKPLQCTCEQFPQREQSNPGLGTPGRLLHRFLKEALLLTVNSFAARSAIWDIDLRISCNIPRTIEQILKFSSTCTAQKSMLKS